MPATASVPPMVLLVDDDPNVRLMLASLLRMYIPANAIASAADGLKALEHLDEYNIPLVITDNQMPGLTGLELIDITKARRPDTRMILISGDVHNNIERRGYECGADYVLLKPFPIAQLKAILDRALIPTQQERTIGQF